MAPVAGREHQKYGGRGTMIIVDGVYSMEGDIADVPGLLKLAQQHGSALAIDDAHSVGVLGPRGDGTAAHFGSPLRPFCACNSPSS